MKIKTLINHLVMSFPSPLPHCFLCLPDGTGEGSPSRSPWSLTTGEEIGLCALFPFPYLTRIGSELRKCSTDLPATYMMDENTIKAIKSVDKIINRKERCARFRQKFTELGNWLYRNSIRSVCLYTRPGKENPTTSTWSNTD